MKYRNNRLNLVAVVVGGVEMWISAKSLTLQAIVTVDKHVKNITIKKWLYTASTEVTWKAGYPQSIHRQFTAKI